MTATTTPATGVRRPPGRIRTADEAVAVATDLAADFGPGAAERDRQGTVPRTELATLDRSGLLAITVPVEHGGPDLPATVLAEVIRRLAAADPALAQVLQGHFLLVDAVRVRGQAKLQALLFPEVLGGARLASALAERGTADAQDLQTRLRPGDEGWRLDGRKYYCTGAVTARWLGVSARAGERLYLAVVPRSAAGVVLDEDWHAMGQRATVSGGARFTGVALTADRVVPYGDLFCGPQTIGARAQLIHAAIEVGIAGAALADGTAFLRDRARPFFEPVRRGLVTTAADDPYNLLRLGRLAARVRAAEALLGRAAEDLSAVPLLPATIDEAAAASLAVAAAKAFASDVAVETASEVFALTGASGTDVRLGLDRHWRNARTHSVHDPVDWKYHHLGAWLATGTPPPNHGQL
jgi:SfnB family sulfur acquisition oxidoreductase